MGPKFLDLIDEWGKALLTVAGAFAIFAGVGRWLRKRWEKDVIKVVKIALDEELRSLGQVTQHNELCLEEIERLNKVIFEELDERAEMFRELTKAFRENREWLIDLQTFMDAENMAKAGIKQDRRVLGYDQDRRRRSEEILDKLENRQFTRRRTDKKSPRGNEEESF